MASPGRVVVHGRFWLKRHGFFRELAGLLSGSIAMLHEESFEPREFANWFVPRLDYLLSDLEGHHHIEDAHYFPIFQAAEPRLRRSFDILDSDHRLVHDLLESNAAAGRQFLDGFTRGGDAMLFAAEAYGSQADRLVTGLMRHLEDEEDLVVPLLLDRADSDEVLM